MEVNSQFGRATAEFIDWVSTQIYYSYINKSLHQSYTSFKKLYLFNNYAEYKVNKKQIFL